MVKDLSIQEVNSILQNGEFEELVGAVEGQKLEAKSEPYYLAKDHVKQEFAKDIVGFANTKGGVILLGVKTKRDPVHFGDEIESIRPFEQKLINPSQYHDVLSRWVYPPLEKLEVHWFPMAGDKEKGIGAIFIPEQDPNRHPFLVTKTIDDNGRRVELVFGFAERRVADVIPMSVQELQGIIRDGMRFDTLSRKMDVIQGTLEHVLQGSEGKISGPNSKREEALKEKIEVALREGGLTGRPAYVIATLPLFNVDPPNLLLGRDSEITQLIDNPPQLRHSGFDLNTGSLTKIIRGQLRQSASPGWKILQFWRDGTLIFAATGDRDFLCWGNYPRASPSLIVNPLVLAESTFLFAELALWLFKLMDPAPDKIKCNMELRGMPAEESSSGLVPFPLRTMGWRIKDEIHRPPEREAELHVVWKIGDSSPGALAYALLKELYMWFGVDPDRIPYKEKLNDHWEVTAEQIKSDF